MSLLSHFTSCPQLLKELNCFITINYSIPHWIDYKFISLAWLCNSSFWSQTLHKQNNKYFLNCRGGAKRTNWTTSFFDLSTAILIVYGGRYPGFDSIPTWAGKRFTYHIIWHIMILSVWLLVFLQSMTIFREVGQNLSALIGDYILEEEADILFLAIRLHKADIAITNPVQTAKHNNFETSKMNAVVKMCLSSFKEKILTLGLLK